jgi:membrane fusion protein, heavy metal efflux system
MTRRLSACLPNILWITALLASPAFAAPGAHGPNGEHLDGPLTINTSGLARLPDGSVSVPKPAQRRMAIRTVVGIAAEHSQTVELNGRVAIDPSAGGRVQAAHGGRITPGPRGLPVVGQRVAKGEALAYVQHHAAPYELGNQQAQLSELRANRTLADKRLKRLEALEGSVPQKEIDAARAEFESVIARERAIAGSLRTTEALTAPVGGVIATTSALAGQIVESKDVLFEIIDPARLTIEAATHDPQLGTRITGASLAGLSDVELTLLGAGRKLNEGALPLVFRARAKTTALVVGQPVTVVATLADKASGIALPFEAIVRNAANEPVVWIKAGAERFVPQPVEFKPLNATSVVVTKGLAPDNRVVISGAALINQIR